MHDPKTIRLFLPQLEAKVTAMSNQQCAEWLSNNVTNNRLFRKSIKDNFKNGITPNILCTKGIKNETIGYFTVRILLLNWFICKIHFIIKLKYFQQGCEGDSGGPLFINRKIEGNKITNEKLAGLFGGGLNCGKENIPTWSTRISYYYDWIICTVENAQKDKTHRDVERACFRKVKRYDTDLAFPILL